VQEASSDLIVGDGALLRYHVYEMNVLCPSAFAHASVKIKLSLCFTKYHVIEGVYFA
jgi:hypothetical protein